MRLRVSRLLKNALHQSTLAEKDALMDISVLRPAALPRNTDIPSRAERLHILPRLPMPRDDQACILSSALSSNCVKRENCRAAGDRASARPGWLTLDTQDAVIPPAPKRHAVSPSSFSFRNRQAQKAEKSATTIPTRILLLNESHHFRQFQ